uniref:uncharacterized protein LOC118518149 isoform X2 n=1 Tax=Halichoerus grypus TaxID=9711 RepID=UPI0016596ABB|nr:uncharacterized protein LOC118518149 isoform X2 [Halichoerus grypus]XP_035920607.1 uncharacterized protein LOC118518149 isoform X2 [Halichoerus grypus]XP_035920608.1 uncharacterized protein LOC118518149 isoform X2 [Halichoerus grypus]XP_035920609.1 uncharacterized protein LOC118518149 isoform X2 [Halichoerus grypus]XP_035920610.1 uncharacterized protein LOC118518149 isoform X2 [Halichoerus grypus]XP_035920611.1 uncharacterized protein LOC118518149 isoform X2 [Halichoerus grypus]
MLSRMLGTYFIFTKGALVSSAETFSRKSFKREKKERAILKADFLKLYLDSFLRAMGSMAPSSFGFSSHPSSPFTSKERRFLPLWLQPVNNRKNDLLLDQYATEVAYSFPNQTPSQEDGESNQQLRIETTLRPPFCEKPRPQGEALEEETQWRERPRNTEALKIFRKVSMVSLGAIF